LAYFFSGGRLIFASHEFGLVKSGLVPAGLSEEKLAALLLHQHLFYDQTVFSHVRKIVPGDCVSFSGAGCRVAKYWRPEDIQKDKSLSFEAAAGRLRKLIVAATCNRMEPGRIGMHVSGGSIPAG
jgi:asparagine synthase (glutamine-hydrolysing)